MDAESDSTPTTPPAGDSETPAMESPASDERSSVVGASPEPGSSTDPTSSVPASAGADGAVESQIWIHRSRAGRVRRSADSVQPLDFRNPTFFSPGVMRRLRLRHEEFVRALSARMSLHLRMEFSIHLGKVHTQPYRAFTSGLADPTHLTLFRVEPLPGICVVDVPGRLALTIVDRLLGGPAHALTTDHTPSEIELALLSQAVQVVVSEWASFWSGSQELRAVILGYENNGRFLRTAPHDTVMLVLSLDAKLGECAEPVSIAFPHYTVEPLVVRMGQSPEKSAGGVPVVRHEKVAWNPLFADVPVTITAEWEGVELAARDVANLKIGDVVPLDMTCAEEVRVRLGEVPRFHARLGSAGDQLAVELTGPLKT